MGRYSANLRANILRRKLQIPGKPQKIIDIGAGSGAIARSLDRDNHTVLAVDVVDHGLYKDTPIHLYDGAKLPFGKDSFDYAVLAFVLHHTEDYMSVLRDAARVSAKGLVVLEDTPSNKLELWLWRKIDYFLNHRKHKDIDEAHHEFSEAQLISKFEQLGLEVVRAKGFRTVWPVFSAYKHTSFLVRKTEEKV